MSLHRVREGLKEDAPPASTASAACWPSSGWCSAKPRGAARGVDRRAGRREQRAEHHGAAGAAARLRALVSGSTRRGLRRRRRRARRTVQHVANVVVRPWTSDAGAGIARQTSLWGPVHARRAPSPLQGALHGQIEHVALCMTATQPVGRTSQARQQRCCTPQHRQDRKPTSARQAVRPSCPVVRPWRVDVKRSPGERALKTAALLIARADEGQHGVDLVEAAKAVLHMRRPGRGLRTSAAQRRRHASRCATGSAEASIRSATSGVCPARFAGIQVQSRSIRPCARWKSARCQQQCVATTEFMSHPAVCWRIHRIQEPGRSVISNTRHDVMRASIQRVQDSAARAACSARSYSPHSPAERYIASTVPQPGTYDDHAVTPPRHGRAFVRHRR